jgi:hypothetical protein
MFARTLAFGAIVFAISLPAPAGTPAAAVRPPAVARLGIELPTLGGANWFTAIRDRYFSASVMRDIRDGLQLDYVRTGWVPGRLAFEKVRWYREDQGMDAICSAGLKLMIIVPGLGKDRYGDVIDPTENVREFFDRYTQREFGCIAYAEIANEADLAKNGFSGVDAYADYYARVAPIVAAYRIPVITTGTSGEDIPWTAALSERLLQSGAPVSGYGFHPYGIAPAGMASALQQVGRAAAVDRLRPPPVYVTELGERQAEDLYEAIVSLAHVTPAITLYEYLPQTGEDPNYAIASDVARYRAVQRAAAWVRTLRGSARATSTERVTAPVSGARPARSSAESGRGPAPARS